jgi:hypothetical protein
MAVLEARVACPLCGGLIHPVAGRCKHCKEDLSAMRAGRPAAQAPLPALNHQNNHVPAGQTIPNPVVAATYIAPVPIAMPREGSQPILPPRPTGRSVAVPQIASPLRSWPVIVIGLAAVAIIAAVAIMVWPPAKPGRDHAPVDQHGIQPPPAPEHMDSDPLPAQQDPWAAHSQADPPAPRHTPDPLPAKPDDNTLLPSGQLGALTGGAPGTQVMLAVMNHACTRLKTCPDTDESVRDMCDVFSQYQTLTATPDCAAAKQCLDEVDKLDCQQAATPTSLLSTIPSCLKAATSC